MNNVKKILSCFSCQKWGCDLYTHATYTRINTVLQVDELPEQEIQNEETKNEIQNAFENMIPKLKKKFKIQLQQGLKKFKF